MVWRVHPAHADRHGTGGGITSYAVWKPMNAAAVAAATDCAVVFGLRSARRVTQVAYEWLLPARGLTGWCEISRIGLVDLTAQGIDPRRHIGGYLPHLVPDLTITTRGGAAWPSSATQCWATPCSVSPMWRPVGPDRHRHPR